LLTGVNIEATAELARAVNLPVIASGGLAELAEIRALRLKKGISGVIAGRSLYDGRIDLKAALAAAV
ncbi:MAG: HisA/HisF-related TIM barrel protein, partial [Sandaracinobacter sp.]